MRVFFSSIAALAIGLLQSSLVIFSLSIVAQYSPIPEWLARNGFSGNELVLGVTVADFPIIFVLWLPAGYVLSRLRPLSIWAYLALAVVPSWIWLNRILFSQGVFSPIDSLLLSWGPELVAPVVATLVMSRFVRPQRPNNSFKPKPLRGSA
jgi:hypothetical protein